MPFPDGAFDLVTFENALHHVTDIASALAEAMRVARRAVVIIDPWMAAVIWHACGTARYRNALNRSSTRSAASS